MTLIQEPNVAATHAMIWMHGLGASNQDMVGVVDAMQIKELPIRHVFLQAPNRAVTINQGMMMPAWYDIVGDSLTDREDQQGILSSEKLIINAIGDQEKHGISNSKVFLAGFSQGAAMALHCGINYSKYLAGVIALSGYLPLADSLEAKQRKTLPIFMASGDNDHIVLPLWTSQTQAKLVEAGYKRITLNKYPMMHEICMEEISELKQWLVGFVDS